MDKPVENFWKIRQGQVKEALEANNFEVHLAESAEDAKRIVLDEILPKVAPQSIGWGGSMTFHATGLYKALKDDSNYEVIDPFDQSVSREEQIERRRRALLVDLFISGTNAVTETGKLVNLDGFGNRVAAITFGPRHVVVLVGRNKVTADVGEAMFRVKDYAAPTNAMRLGRKTPCVKSASCEDCDSPDRICNTWTITEKSNPKHRVKVVLINEELGL
jgi:L-lactate utilization protein LutB